MEIYHLLNTEDSVHVHVHGVNTVFVHGVHDVHGVHGNQSKSQSVCNK